MSTVPVRGAYRNPCRVPYEPQSREKNRGPYQGVLQILEFNWSMYLAAVAALATAGCAAPFLRAPLRAAVLCGAVLALVWLVSSLLVSHYVYDRSGLYHLHWLARALSHRPRRWINIHSGWDETSGQLTQIFPGAVGEAVDLFDPTVMTEASIRRARRANLRRVNHGFPVTPARYDALPFENASVDTAFAIFAAHELRRRDQRLRLFQEIARVLIPGGQFLLVEQNRDRWNFLAFGPGSLHFFSRREWNSAAADAELIVRSEFAFTPFVHVTIMRSKP